MIARRPFWAWNAMGLLMAAYWLICGAQKVWEWNRTAQINYVVDQTVCTPPTTIDQYLEQHP